MNKELIKLAVLVGILSFMIGILFGVGIAMIPEGKCLKNPLNYGISAYGDFTCNCYSNKGFEYSGFSFNKTGVFSYGGN